MLYPLDKELELKMSGISLGAGDPGAGSGEVDTGDTGDNMLHLARVVDKMEIRDTHATPP